MSRLESDDQISNKYHLSNSIIFYFILKYLSYTNKIMINIGSYKIMINLGSYKIIKNLGSYKMMINLGSYKIMINLGSYKS